jgi:RNA 3'-terminal phosphate cyclase (GTP)
VLRSSLAFSALTGRAFRIHNIRGKRSRPGLRPQHLAAVNLAADLCNAQTKGAELNSSDLQFEPGPVSPGTHRVDVGTAGSVTLLTQAVLLPALMCGQTVEFELIGGTDVPMAPPVDYLTEVVVPYFRRLGEVEVQVERRGFHPKGQGYLRLRVQGRPISETLKADQKPEWGGTKARIAVSKGLREARVAERIQDCLSDQVDTIDLEYVDASSDGVALTLWATDAVGHRLGVSRLGRPRLKSEKLARQSLDAFHKRLAQECLIEEHLADQLIPILALTGGQIRCQTISGHCHTNMRICSLFTQKAFQVQSKNLISI